MNAVTKQEVLAPAASEAATLMLIIDRAAKDPAFDVAKLQQLLAVKERWEANEARKAFVVALNAFKANPPELHKNKHVKFGTTEYDHATLDQVSNVVGAALSAHGLSHRWDVAQDAGQIKVTCVLTHALGHSERVTMQSEADKSGAKNSIQAIGSAVTYLQRYTLLAATGMAVKGNDNDGNDENGLPESVRADHIAAMESAANLNELQAAFKAAYEAAKDDKRAAEAFIRAKDVRKVALTRKAAA